MGTRCTPEPVKPWCKCWKRLWAARTQSAVVISVGVPRLPMNGATVPMVCSTVHLYATLRRIGNALQSVRQLASTRRAKPAANGSALT